MVDLRCSSFACANINGKGVQWVSLTSISVGAELAAVGLGGSRLHGSVTLAIVAVWLEGASLRSHLGYSNRNEKTKRRPTSGREDHSWGEKDGEGRGGEKHMVK